MKSQRSARREHHESLTGRQGRIIWIHGRAGTGKTAAACALEPILRKRGYFCYVLDERNTNKLSTLRNVARFFADAGIVVIVAARLHSRYEQWLTQRELCSCIFREVLLQTEDAEIAARGYTPCTTYHRAARADIVLDTTDTDAHAVASLIAAEVVK